MGAVEIIKSLNKSKTPLLDETTLQKEIHVNENASLLLRFLMVTDHLVTMARQTFKNKFNQKYALK